MRSVLSQRPMLLAEMAGNEWLEAIFRASSARLQRVSGTPWVRGKLQAVAVTCARISGGKTPRRPRASSVSQASGGDPSRSPLAYLSVAAAHLLGNLLIAPLWMGMGQKHDPDAYHQGLSCPMGSGELA